MRVPPTDAQRCQKWKLDLSQGMHGFPGSRAVKNLPANAGDARDAGSIPGSGRSPRGGSGNPLQHSPLEHSTDRGAWRATVQGVTKSQTWLSTHTHTHKVCISPSDQTPQMQLEYKEQRSIQRTKSPVISDLLGEWNGYAYCKKKKKCLYLGKARCKGKNAETYYTKKTEVGRQCKWLITTTITDT